MFDKILISDAPQKISTAVLQSHEHLDISNINQVYRIRII